MNWKLPAIAVALAAGLGLAVIAANTADGQEETLAGAGERVRALPQSRGDMQLSFAPVVREAAPAVVNVYSRRFVADRNPFAGDPMFERFFGPQAPRQREVQSLGSGVIVDEAGLIVTNNHVVAGAQELRVVLYDRRELEAEILLADERTDLAVLRVVADEPLPVLPFDLTGSAEVGDLVLAIGNPFGVGQTVTSGIVSALARTDVGITDYAFFIQTDAAINPGNSGGALVSMNGELLGINTAIFSRSGGSQGIGFAIPAEMVRSVVQAATNGGELVRPWLGARLQPVTSDIALSMGFDRPRGVLVSDVYPGGPADSARLRQGDIILSVDGVDVNNEAAVRFRFATRTIGEESQVRLMRDGQERTVTVLAEAPPGEREGERLVLSGRNPFSGAELVQLSPAFNDANGIDPFLEGLIVTGVQRRSAAEFYGFQPGDRVLSVNRRSVRDLAEIELELERSDNAREWPVEIERRGERFARTLRL
ncbi:MAG: DegQ family serine endoprotease [Caulobacterales bacterium]|uniref:DegQ family serine endoprotease n=1 Tax=Glycocaulis sp. TaxID=1969725 RepID=UPI003F9F92CD